MSEKEALPNGNGSPAGATIKSDEPEENIFTFIPNQIGKPSS